MKISLLSAWNTDSGAAVHAELIGREWQKMGHKISVFSFIKTDFHGKNFLRKDESYVIRCFGTPRTNFFDPRPIIQTPADIIIVEDLGMLPKDKLGKIFPLLKKKSKTINVIHDNKPSPDPSFWQFDWNKVIVFDENYKEVFKNFYPEEKLKIIPYPCTSWQKGNRNLARRNLNLPQDKKIIFIFGWWIKYFIPHLSIIKKLSREYPLYLLAISKDIVSKEKFVSLENKNLKVDFKENVLTQEKLYNYLHAADILVFGAKPTKGVVVCSSALMTIGSGCPIIAPDINFFRIFKNNEIIKYKNNKELEKGIIDIFEKGKIFKRTIKAAKKFVKKNNSRVIAEKFIKLFENLK